MYFVYILYSDKCNKYYIGQTESLTRRVEEHNQGKGGALPRLAFLGHLFTMNLSNLDKKLLKGKEK